MTNKAEETLLKCKKCGHKIQQFEHYVLLQDGTVLDETCFFEMAIKELKVKEKQRGFEEGASIVI